MKRKSPEQQLQSFIDKFTAEIAALGRAVLAKLRARLPGANEMVYDNFNWLVIGFSPNERPSDAIFSVVIAPRAVSVCFLQGAGLPDPHRLLKGSGKVVRNVRIEDADDLERPEVQQLIAVALQRARVPWHDGSDGQLVIKSVSAKQRPRRPTKQT